MKKILPRLGFAIVLIYLGVSAYSEIGLARSLKSPKSEEKDPRIYDGNQFPNSRELAIYIREGIRDKYHPWTRPLEEWQCLAVLSIVTGGLGGIARDIRELTPQPVSSKGHGFYVGLIIGPILLLISVLYPAIMTESSVQFRPASVAAVCFLGGLFSENAWNFIETIATQTFKKS